MKGSSLAVYVSGSYCGELTENRYGALCFAYDRSYDGVPLSLSMPIGLARYDDRVVRPYLMGLLPDDQETRVAIGAPFGVSGDNPFRLLRIVGRDCPGAIQILEESDPAPAEDSMSDLIALSEEDVERRLAEVRENAAFAWTGAARSEGRWSLGGCQAKIALRYQGGTWHECRGAAATTHIVKPGVTGFDSQALVEYLSMKIAREIGLPAAEVNYRFFGREEAIVVTRYDRAFVADGAVHRLHQEDLCQAMSVFPQAKYADQGGPSTPRIISLLKETGRNARENVYRFILYLFFNYLIGATDAHAKNHSLIHVGRDDVRLAPLYDVASIAPYRSLAPTQRKPLRAALSIGGENRFGMVGSRNVESMVEANNLEDLGLGASFLCERLEVMARLVPEAAERVVGAAEEMSGIERVGPPLVREIAANCRRMRELL